MKSHEDELAKNAQVESKQQAVTSLEQSLSYKDEELQRISQNLKLNSKI